MDERKELVIECPPDLEARTMFDLDEMVRRSIEHYGSPSALFDELVTSISDDELLDFAGLVQRVNSITFEYLDGVGDKECWIDPLYPDFTRAEVMADGRFRVPIADRHSFQRFLQHEDVAEALDTYYLWYLQDEEDELLDDEDSSTDNQEQVSLLSQIETLPVTVEPLDTTTLFVIAGACYWSEQGADKYISPADTLEDIAKNAPPEMLIPLILAIEEHFPLEVDDHGCYKPVIWTNHTQEYLVENGVVWQVYSDKDMRWQVEFACKSDEPVLNLFHGFNGERFEEEFYETLAHLSHSETDKFGEAAVDTVRAEQDRRYGQRYSWLFRSDQVS